MSDTTPDVLRDTLFIWMYVTITRFDDVVKGVPAPTLLNDLEQGKHIKVGDPQNKKTVDEAVLAVGSFPNEIPKVNKALKSLSAVAGAWGGSGQHPKLTELDSVYISPRA
jgi:hypothetical protein